MYEQPTAPQSIGGVLDNGIKLFKASFSKVFALAFVGTLASNLPSVYLTRQLQGAMADPAQNPEAIAAVFGPGFVLLTLVAVLFYLVVFAAMIARIDAVARNAECSIGDALGIGLRRFLAIIGVGLLYSLAVGIGMVLLVIPGIILAVSLYCGMYLVIIDRTGPVESLIQSHKLVWGDWWRTATILTIALIIAMVVFILVGVVAGVAAIGGGDPTTLALTPLWWDLLLAPAVTAVVMPLMYSMPYAMLQDLKLRRGGSDLMDRMESLESA